MKLKAKYLPIIVLIIFPFFVLALRLLGGGLGERLRFLFEDSKVYVTTSTSFSGYQAAFVYHGALQGRTITLVAGSDLDEKTVVGNIGYVDMNPSFQEAYWSSDGTVIAVRGSVAKTGVSDIVFTHAYDFRRGKIIASKALYKEDANSILGKAKEIEKLIEERGGNGIIISKVDISFNARKLSLFERRKWDKILCKN